MLGKIRKPKEYVALMYEVGVWGSLAELRIASRSFGVRIQLFRYEPEPYETIGLELQNPRGIIRLMHTIGIHFNCLLNKHQMASVTKMPKFVDHETLM